MARPLRGVGQHSTCQGASLAARPIPGLCGPSRREPLRPPDGGSVYRDELEEVLTGKLSQEYDFQRGTKDPCVFLDRRSGLILLHHIDDIRVAGPKAAVLKFTVVDLPKHCEITVGELEEPGTAVEVLGRTKVRTEEAVLTLPDIKHAENVCEQLGIGPEDKGTAPSKPLDLTKVEELSAGDAARFRSAVGSAIYLSADRRDIQFAVKELARRMQTPRVCGWLAGWEEPSCWTQRPKAQLF